MARLREIQESMRRLSDLKAGLLKNDPSGVLLINRQTGVQQKLDVATAKAIIAWLEEDAVEIEDQFASARTMGGYFYPINDPRYSEDGLHYYRQREWRIIMMWMRRGNNITAECTEQQRGELLEIDHDYFSRPIEMLNDIRPRVEFCEYLSILGGVAIQQTIRRVIVPNDMIGEASALIRDHHLPAKVVPLEALRRSPAGA